MASFTKRDGRWRARVRRQGHPTLTKTFATKGEAQTWARNIESSMDTGTWRDQRAAHTTTLHEALDDYERLIVKKKKSQDKEESRVRLWQASKLSAYYLTVIRGRDLAQWRDDRLEAGRSGGTVRRDLAMIEHLYNVARKEWGMEGLVNPMQDVAKPPPGRGRTQRVTPEEEAALLAVAAGHYVHALIVLAIETAMRRGELIALRWEHIDLKRGTALLPDTKNDDERIVPLSARAREALAALPRGIDGRVFQPGEDRMIGAWRSTRLRSGLTHIRFHDMRHEATSRLAETGRFSLIELAAITGHKDLQMLKRYTHPRAHDLAERLR